MEKIKQFRVYIIAFSVVTILFVWAELGGFKLFRFQSGDKWSPREHTGSIHHK